MVIETENRNAEALLPPSLLDHETREAILANPNPSALFDSDGRTPLWSSHGAARRFGYRDAQSLMRSRLPDTAPGTRRLAELAVSDDDANGTRLERLRFFVGFRGIILTTLVKKVTLRTGQVALLVTIPANAGSRLDDALEALPPRALAINAITEVTPEAMLRADMLHPVTEEDTSLQEEELYSDDLHIDEALASLKFEQPESAAETQVQDSQSQPSRDVALASEAADAAPEPAPTPLHWTQLDIAARKPRRFVFRLDHAGIVEHVTPPLAETVGTENATLIGKRLSDEIAVFDAQAGAQIAHAVDAGETWTGLRIVWPVSDSDLLIPVELSALPLIEADRGMTGYSGFGLCRIEAAFEEPKTDAQQDSEEWQESDDGQAYDDADNTASEPVHQPTLETALPAVPHADVLPLASVLPLADVLVPADILPSQNDDDIMDDAGDNHAQDERDAHGGDETPADLLLERSMSADNENEMGESDAQARVESQNDSHTPDAPNPPISNTDYADIELKRGAFMNGTMPQEPVPPDHQELARQLAAFSRQGEQQGKGEQQRITGQDVTNASQADANVVSIRTGQPTNPIPGFQRQGLSMSERNAFREIAKALGARFDEDDTVDSSPPAGAGSQSTFVSSRDASSGTDDLIAQLNSLQHGHERQRSPENLLGDNTGATAPPVAPRMDASVPSLLDRLPIGILVLKGDMPLLANRTLLDLTGYPDFKTFFEQDGARAIFRKSTMPRDERTGFDTIVLASRDGEMMPVDAHLQIVDWDGDKATMISVRRAVELEQGKALRSVALDLKRVRAESGELRAILDTATDGVITLDEKGQILSLNGAAEALFGLHQNEIVGESFTRLLINESHADALDYLDGLRANGVRSVLNDGREVFGREKKGGRIPLFMTLGRISDEEPRRFCAVLRDMTAWKRAESELTEARRAAELASAKKSDFLAKISHEIRTPMNAIMGFAEVMQEERLGPLGNAKYKEYLGDIRTSGQHVVSLVNDLLDLAKIEAGRMEMTFAATDLNAVIAGCVGIIQPQANSNRVLVRTQLAQKLPPVVADERSIRQIVLNMLSNATRFTEAGGQVIVATALLDSGEAVIRIRDTGIGMSSSEIEQALEPFRQVGTQRNKGGTGLGLPLTKALVEANRANFTIRSTPGEGTLIEVTFPSTRVLAE